MNNINVFKFYNADSKYKKFETTFAIYAMDFRLRDSVDSVHHKLEILRNAGY